MKKVLVRAPAMSMSGYGEQARFLLRALRSRPDLFEIFIEDIPWGKTGSISTESEEANWIKGCIGSNAILKHSIKEGAPPPYDMSIQVTIPNEWRKLAPINIGYTAGIECDRVTPEWVELGNCVDKIITISEHSKEVYKSSTFQYQNQNHEVVRTLKLTTPISHIGYSVRCLEEEPNFELDLDTEFNFLSISQLGPRKNTVNMVNWFIKEFHDEPIGLVLKTHLMNCSHLDEKRTENIINNIAAKYPDKKCKIYLIHGEMTDKEMCSLYKHPKIKSYLTFTHGEGFGLPIFEAVCNGLPIIAPSWSGHIDYLYGEIKKKGKKSIKPLFCKVPFSIDPVGKEAFFKGLINEESKWCFVKEVDAKISMRKMHKNYNMYLSWAKKLEKQTLEKFTEEKMYALFVEELNLEQNTTEEPQGQVFIL